MRFSIYIVFLTLSTLFQLLPLMGEALASPTPSLVQREEIDVEQRGLTLGRLFKGKSKAEGGGGGSGGSKPAAAATTASTSGASASAASKGKEKVVASSSAPRAEAKPFPIRWAEQRAAKKAANAAAGIPKKPGTWETMKKMHEVPGKPFPIRWAEQRDARKAANAAAGKKSTWETMKEMHRV